MSVEQAAERLRTYIGYDPIVRACSDYEPDEDCVKLADEYLRLFDPTPLSEEILRASTWCKGHRCHFVNPFCEFTLARSVVDGDTFYKVEAYPLDLGYVTTVGDLRLLLSALHIDCEVVVPESEASNG